MDENTDQQTPDWVNGELRTDVLKAVNLIKVDGVPVGSVLSMIIGFFWSDPENPAKVWDSIKEYAEQLVDSKVTDAKVNELKDRLVGLQKVANDYRDTSSGNPQKGQFLTSLLADLDLFEQDFWKDAYPERVLPLFTSFGTLYLFTLAEQVYCYEQAYGVADLDAQAHMDKLRKAVDRYTAGAEKLFNLLYARRFRRLQIREWQSVSASQSESEWWLFDRQTGDMPLAHHRGSDWGHNYHNPIGKACVERAYRRRLGFVRNGYVEQLQHYLGVAHLWRCLVRDNPLPAREYSLCDDIGPWGECGGAAFTVPPAAGRISEIRIRHGQVVECLEILYDGVSASVHGNSQGGALSSLVLEPDEFVVEVYGRAGLFVDQLYFVTNRGRKVGGGGEGGQPFRSRGQSFWKEVGMHGVSGHADGLRLTGVNFQWRHQVDVPAYVPAYLQAPAVAMDAAVHLQTEDDRHIGALVNEYSGKAGSNEYWPRIADVPVGLQLHPVRKQATMHDGDLVQLRTLEPAAKGYDCLSTYTSINLYYYTNSDGDQRQQWEVLKVMPDAGPVREGEYVRLRSVDRCAYLAPAPDGYLVAQSAPYDWRITVVRA